MSAPQGLAETDVREIVRLLSDVAILDGGLADKKRALMTGLQRLVAADGWLWSVTRVDVATQTPISIGLMHAGLNNEQLAGWLEASQSSCPPPEDAPMFELTRTGKHFTRSRQQVVADDEWYSHPAVVRHRLRQGIEHFLYSVYPLDKENELYSAIGLFRFCGRSGFSDRESRIAHILLSEVEWLHFAELPGDRGRKVPLLTPRQRVVLIMLIEAHDKDEISRLLHISPHTVKDHIKAIYEHFEVSSQLELIRRFRFGDAGHALEVVSEA
jgi:DNA-binding CsgD family transcriptional regulator